MPIQANLVPPMQTFWTHTYWYNFDHFSANNNWNSANFATSPLGTYTVFTYRQFSTPFCSLRRPLFHLLGTMDGAKAFFEMQFRCLFKEFTSSGLPWRGEKCRSLLAGGSGILYALAALGCPTLWEQAMWVSQALISVWADYFHVHHDHVAHGIDRYYASFMTMRMTFICFTRLQPYMALLAVIPIGCCSRSAKAKADRDVDRWIFWHFWWHAAGSLLTLLAMVKILLLLSWLREKMLCAHLKSQSARLPPPPTCLLII